MTRVRTIGVLNVVAQPHPNGIYRTLFDAAADASPVKFRGPQYAKTSPVSGSDDGVFRGRLAIWTEIDPESPTIDKSSFEQKLLSDSDIALPSNIGFNSKIFYFSFREKDHQLFVELGNDEGQTVSANVARTAFAAVLAQVSEGLVEDVTVHVATNKNAVEHVLAIKMLNKVEIQLDIPNPDDLGDEHARVLQEIEDMKAKRLKSEIVKANGEETLILSERYKVLADLAKDNGYVKSVGVDEGGEKRERSTKDYPRELEVVMQDDDSSYIVIRRVALEANEQET